MLLPNPTRRLTSLVHLFDAFSPPEQANGSARKANVFPKLTLHVSPVRLWKELGVIHEEDKGWRTNGCLRDVVNLPFSAVTRWWKLPERRLLNHRVERGGRESLAVIDARHVRGV